MATLAVTVVEAQVNELLSFLAVKPLTVQRSFSIWLVSGWLANANAMLSLGGEKYRELRAVVDKAIERL